MDVDELPYIMGEATCGNLRRRLEPGVLRQSAKMMSAQAKSRHQVFNSWPQFVRNTLWHSKAAGFEESWRCLPVQERLAVARRLKDEGGELYRKGEFSQAAERYSRAAGLFHYVQASGKIPPGTTIDYSYVRLVTDEYDGGGAGVLQGNEKLTEDMSQSQNEVRSLRATCYSNIAQCLLRQPKPDNAGARQACDEALLLQPQNVKALYRRALAAELDGSRQDLEAALEDLVIAVELEPSDTAMLTAKRRVHAEIRKQHQSERRMFQGVLQKRSLGGSEEREAQNLKLKEAVAAEAAQNTDVEKALEEAARLRASYLANGQIEEASEMDGVIARCKERLAERSSREYNFFEPTEELKEEAKKFGLDLQNPDAQRELDHAMWDTYQAHECILQEETQAAAKAQQTLESIRKWAGKGIKDFVMLAFIAAAFLQFIFMWRGAPEP